MAATASVIWFRQGLRLHDNPALLAAIAEQEQQHSALLPIFIFDGESASTKSVGYNRMCFLLQSLRDLDEQLHEASGGSGQLYILRGQPVQLFRQLHQQIRLRRICFEQDCDPISSRRDNAVKSLCQELSIECVEQVSHTLWDPRLVIDTNGGIPPLTYQMFLHTVQIIGLPRRPVALPDWRGVSFMKLTSGILKDLHAFSKFPTSEQLNVFPDNFGYVAKVQWRGGERQALQQLKQRLTVEENAFKRGFYLPNQAHPNVLESSKSLSAHLCFGCLSVCRFYWDVHDLFKHVQLKSYAPGMRMSDGAHITGQLIWREYFYTMSMNNPNYDRMQGNEICLNIPWAPASLDQLQRWQTGRTGYPLIDAAMRQLLAEGWLHHTLRNTVATFLTRGGLWQNWEHGLQHFLKYLLDADLAVCAGNWMWVSSSAFESLLDSSLVTCPVALAKRLDPHGQYTKQYVAELAQVPQEYIHEPWLMPSSVQQQSECIIGVHYPERMIDLAVASRRNMLAMKILRHSLVTETAPEGPPHCQPSSAQEVRQFFWLPE